MLNTSLKAQTIVRCHATKSGDVEVTAQRYNDYFTEDHESVLFRISEKDGKYTVAILGQNVSIQQLVSEPTI